MPAFYEAFQQCPEIKSSHGLKRGSRKLDILRSLSEKRGQRGCIRMTGLQRDVKWSKPSKPLAQPPTPALSGSITVSTNYTDSTLLVFSIPMMSSQETCILHQVLASLLQRTEIYNAPTLDGWEEPSCDRGLLEDIRAGDIFNPAASLKSTSYMLRTNIIL